MGYESLSTVVVLAIVIILMVFWLPKRTVKGMKRVIEHREDRFSPSLHLVDADSGTRFSDETAAKAKGAIMQSNETHEGKLTDDERQELAQAAREGATADYDYAGEINALWAAVRALQQSISPPAEDEWPEFVQPTGAGTAYQVGDKVTFKGVRYVCRLPHCVWSPADYPIGWQKQE